MKFRVLKEFVGQGKRLTRESEVDLPASPRTQRLVEQRFLIAIEDAPKAPTKAPKAAKEG